MYQDEVRFPQHAHLRQALGLARDDLRMGSVTIYWCWTGITGTSSPTIAPVFRAKLPVAETTCSQTMSPLSVVTSHSPPGGRSIAMTVVWRLISAPRSRAPLANAWVRSAGWM